MYVSRICILDSVRDESGPHYWVSQIKQQHCVVYYRQASMREIWHASQILSCFWDTTKSLSSSRLQACYLVDIIELISFQLRLESFENIFWMLVDQYLILIWQILHTSLIIHYNIDLSWCNHSTHNMSHIQATINIDMRGPNYTDHLYRPLSILICQG